MGQYFRIANLSKKEWINPDGWKLWELCANNTIRMLGYLLATNNPEGTSIVIFDEKGCRAKKTKYFGRWCGDKIAVIGDYADMADNVPENAPKWDELKESREWKNITAEATKEFDEFISVEDMKVGSDRHSAIRPDMAITRTWVLHNPKVVRNKRR